VVLSHTAIQQNHTSSNQAPISEVQKLLILETLY
jgi:hypothetical protein